MPGRGGQRAGAGRPKGPPTVVVGFRAPEAWKALLREGESLNGLAASLLEAEMQRRAEAQG